MIIIIDHSSFSFVTQLMLIFRGPVKYVLLGELTPYSSSDDAQSTSYKVVDRIIHEKYTRRSTYFNIALLRLEERVRFNKYIRPACLTTGTTVGGRAMATFWDVTEHDNEATGLLQKVNLHVFTIPQSIRTYESIPGTLQLRNSISDGQLINAGHRGKKSDACRVR